jgi:hypothetical protein
MTRPRRFELSRNHELDAETAWGVASQIDGGALDQTCIQASPFKFLSTDREIVPAATFEILHRLASSLGPFCAEFKRIS